MLGLEGGYGGWGVGGRYGGWGLKREMRDIIKFWGRGGWGIQVG